MPVMQLERRRRRPVKKYVRGTAIVGVLTLAVAACGSKPTESSSGGSANKDFKACMVSDSGGFDDKSFNQTSHKGLTDAQQQLGILPGLHHRPTAKRVILDFRLQILDCCEP